VRSQSDHYGFNAFAGTVRTGRPARATIRRRHPSSHKAFLEAARAEKPDVILQALCDRLFA